MFRFIFTRNPEKLPPGYYDKKMLIAVFLQNRQGKKSKFSQALSTYCTVLSGNLP
jgi:hypothetical protein